MVLALTALPPSLCIAFRAGQRSMRCFAIAFAALAVSACGMESDRGRALLIAVDGASPDLVRSMRAAGELPHFEALARDGAAGELRSEKPLLSPRIWTSVATGRGPQEHGIENWVRRNEDGELMLYTSADRRVHAAWNILSDAGLRVGVVNWLMTHPPEKINGVMISDHALPQITENRLELAAVFAGKMYPDTQGDINAPARESLFAYPPPWVPRFADLMRSNRSFVGVQNPFTAWEDDEHGVREGLIRFFTHDEVVARTALEIEEELDPDLLMVYLPGVDRVSHFLWSALVPQETVPEALRLTAKEAARRRTSLRDYYRFVDVLIGRLMEQYRSGDLVLVISDHGFEAARNPGDMPGIHVSEAALDGILYARGPGIDPRSTPGGVGIRDILPTLLAWFGMPVAENMPGRVVLLAPERVPAAVPSYDTTPIARVGGVDREVEDAVVERLRALGYVD